MEGRLRELQEAGFQWIYGLHPVAEALEQRSRQVERIWVARERLDGRTGRVLKLAREAGIPVRYVTRDVLTRRLGRRAGVQGLAACVAPFSYVDAEELCTQAAECEAAILLLLDRVQDPGNLGAILRVAAGAGVAGVLLASEATAGVSPAAFKASAGLLTRVPLAREARPARRLRALRERSFKVIGLDPRGSRPWDEAELTGRVTFVVGGEARGLRPGLLAECGDRVRIPLARGVDSLNVAVAVGVVLFEAVRQRRAAARGVPAGC